MQIPSFNFNKAPVHNALFAQAHLYGSRNFPNIHGLVNFYKSNDGITVSARVFNLPSSLQPCRQQFFGFHLHEGTSCTGTPADMFANALAHYNPKSCEHPSHAGDFPPLLSNNGNAYLEFTTGNLNTKDIIGKAVIIHRNPDDFTTQPSGNSGEKIACGIVTAV